MADVSKGHFFSPRGEIKASVDDMYPRTIRTASCSLIVSQGKCNSCMHYRSQLRAMHSRWERRSIASASAKFTNHRYMRSPQKLQKLKELQARAYDAERDVKRLREQLEQSIFKNGVAIQKPLSEDLLAIMRNSNSMIQEQFPEGTFRRLFWDQQFKAANTKDSRQMRWHPCMIRWCLNLKLLSSSAYHSLRTSGFLTLPSERTLRDYTHFIKSEPGFTADLDKFLTKEANIETLPEWKKHVVLVLDELKIKESLVYEKHNTRVIGFTDIGDFNNQLIKFERECTGQEKHLPLATHILVLMVRVIFTGFHFPYAHFPTTNIKAEHLFNIVWEAIERLEQIGLKVLVITGDGASVNRTLFRMHGDCTKCTPYKPLYKTPNPYTDEDRPFFFMSDVPHLIKTTRNNWSHSYGHNNTRKLMVINKSLFIHVSCVTWLEL